jgi:hypothetical protein
VISFEPLGRGVFCVACKFVYSFIHETHYFGNDNLYIYFIFFKKGMEKSILQIE